MSIALLDVLAFCPGRAGANEDFTVRCSILIEGNRIARLGTRAEVLAERPAQALEGRDWLVLPGLISAHTHATQALWRGQIPLLPVELWLAEFVDIPPLEDAVVRLATLLTSIGLLRSGVTSILDHLILRRGRERATVELAMDAYRTLGIRVRIAPSLNDFPFYFLLPARAREFTPEEDAHLAAYRPRPAEELLDLADELLSELGGQGDLLRLFVGVAGPLRASDALLRGAGELAHRHSVGIHMHLLESPLQRIAAQERFPGGVGRALEDFGLVSPASSFAHAVWVDDEDMAILAKHGASVVYNPLSNLRCGNGVARAIRLSGMGVNVALGIDSAASHDGEDMQHTLKLAALLQTVTTRDYQDWLTAGEVVRMATEHGARALGEGDLGRLAPGCLADLAVYDLTRPPFLSSRHVLRQMVFQGTARPDRVMVDGRWVVEGSRVTAVDEDLLWARAREALARCTPATSTSRRILESRLRRILASSEEGVQFSALPSM